jgi:hypothetical protein
VTNAAPLMRENEEDMENAGRDCWNGEEIDRGKLLGLSGMCAMFEKAVLDVGVCQRLSAVIITG